jgi:ornithine cyclodeaminase/alanine dehydrogenase-like protein (mu-crystallin family)
MPTSDGTTYGFKYVNGHPKNIASMPTAWTSRIMLSTLTKGTTLSAAI